MSKFFARIEGGAVVELITLPDEIELSDAFHSEIVATIMACGEAVKPGWRYDGNAFSAPVGPSFVDMKARKQGAVEAKVVSLLAAGAPVPGGLHVALDDSSRADMAAMATTAIAASAGAVVWPDSYKEGWISIENSRIPLAAPAAGLALAAGVGDYYAKVRQNGRTLKDAIAAAADETVLGSVDIGSGWPAIAE
ncbi:DUF4376 domain-containing protein [Rhizobium sp. No.120]